MRRVRRHHDGGPARGPGAARVGRDQTRQIQHAQVRKADDPRYVPLDQRIRFIRSIGKLAALAFADDSPTPLFAEASILFTNPAHGSNCLSVHELSVHPPPLPPPPNCLHRGEPDLKPQ